MTNSLDAPPLHLRRATPADRDFFLSTREAAFRPLEHPRIKMEWTSRR